MSRGIATTFDLLTATPNEAATGVLRAALDSSHPAIALAALRGLVARPGREGHREILRRVPRLGAALRGAFTEGSGFMQPVLREALLGESRQECFAACQVVLWAREYDLLPTLLALVGPESNSSQHPHSDLGRRTVLELADILFDELHASRSSPKRRDPQACRGHAVACLEKALRQGAYACPEVVEAFLTVSRREDAGLRQILHDPQDALRDALQLTLGRSRRTSVMRLLASFVDDGHPPLTVLRLLASRGDVEFVQHLLARLGDTLSATETETLRRLESISWANLRSGTLDALDGESQRRAVMALTATSISYAAKLKALAHLAQRGHVAGRRAAVAALANFPDPRADELVLGALDDSDPHVQAAALAQLRQRNLPHAIPRLIERASSHHEVVRQAVRDSLSEFRFERFITNYDTLSEEVRHSTGRLVKQIDPEAVARLRGELTSPSRLRRLRAIEMTQAMDAAPELKHELLAATGDDDRQIAAAAARVLAGCAPTAATAASLLDGLAETADTDLEVPLIASTMPSEDDLADTAPIAT
jgi:HEAT repeat protein